MASNPENSKIEKKGLVAWFAYNHVAANILMLLFLLGGIFSVFNMRTETFPSIDPKTITVSVIYPGATPYEVADSVTRRAEEALIGTQGVKRISSTASEGYGVVTVELEEFTNADDVYNDVETAINGLSDFPPEDAERAVITKTKITPNVLALALYGDVNERSLKYWVERIEDEIRSLDGIGLTDIHGIRDYEINVEVSEDDLRRYDLSLQNIADAIARFSIDIPAGRIESSQGDVALRIQQRGSVGEDFKDIALRTLDNGATLTLGDIARIDDGFEDINLISKFNGQRAAFIDVNRSATQDTLEVARIVKDYLDTVTLPEGLNLVIQDDDTDALRERMSLMMRNAILGFALVFLILLLFLDLKLAFWTSAAIPISFLGGLMMIYFMGYSLNMISLFALIVVLGVVVDDAIITGESIFDAQERGAKNDNLNEDQKNALVLKGVRDVISPVTIGVITTMAAFAPLIFSTGTLGQIIRYIPIVVIPILAVSLIEAYFILPAHLSNPKKWSVGIMSRIRNVFSNGLSWFTDNILSPVSSFAMSWRYVTLAIFGGIVVITIAMFESGIIRFIFFPRIESDRVTISVNLEEGSPFTLTRDIMLEIEDHVLDVRTELSQNADDPFDSVAVTIGQTSGGNRGPRGNGGASNANHIGQVRIQLVSSDLRDVSASDVERMIRQRIENIPGIDTLEFQSSLIGEDADIEVELSHPNAEILNEAASSLRASLENIEGTKEVDDSFELGEREFVFDLTPEGLAVGLTPAALGQQLRGAFFGLEAQRFQRERSEIIVYVRYPKDERVDLSKLRNMRIRLPDGQEVPLKSVASITEQLSYASINSVDGRRIVSVTSDVDYSITTPNDVIAVMNSSLLPDLKARYAGLSYSFEGESREQFEDLQSLGKNMLIALMIIYVLLGSQLRSYVQPLVIMSAIPFGIVGAVWGHYLLGFDLSFISMFGIVALSGVVINDSVVLMDFYNTKKAEGMDTLSALQISIKRRFRPVLLTTLTTSLGLLPILLETSIQARFLIPMAVSLATGIIFATVIILILIPCIVMVIDDIKWVGRKLADMPMRLLNKSA